MTQSKVNKPSVMIGLFVILALLSLNAIGPFYNYQTIVLFGLIPFLFLISFRKDIYTLDKGNGEILIYTLIIIVTLSTIFYGINFELFSVAFNGIIISLIAAYIPIGLNKNYDYGDYFHLGFILSIITLILIEYSIGNFSLTGFANVKASRGRFSFNANYYSYISYFANFSLFYLHLKYKNILTRIVLIILPVLFIILSFVTQSRSGLLFILILNGFYWFTIVKNHNSNVLSKIVQKIVLIVIAVLFVIKLIDTYQNSQIKSRISKSAEDSRKDLASEALNVFADYPVLGVGLGQFPIYSKSGQFSHNSYTEILAEHGIIGGILLLFLFGVPTLKSYHNLKKNCKDPMLRLNFMFFISFLLYNNAYVFYKASYAMIYFFLIISIQNKLNVTKGEI